MSKLYPPGLGVLYDIYKDIHTWMSSLCGVREPRIVGVWSRAGNTITNTYDDHSWSNG